MSRSHLFKKTAEEIDFATYEPSERAKFILSMCRDPYAPPPAPAEEPLSDAERERLAALEGFVLENFAAFYAVGCALREIRRSRLYREKAPTFDKYCRMIETQAAYANRLIAAADVMDDLQQRLSAPKMTPIGVIPQNAPPDSENANDSGKIIDIFPPSADDDRADLYAAPDAPPAVPLPANEAQARPLAKIKDPQERAAVWLDAVRLAGGMPVTATHVKKAINQRLGRRVSRAVQKAADELIYTPARDRASKSFKEAFQHFLNEIYAAQQGNWRETSQAHVIVCLDFLRREIAPDTFDGQRLPMPTKDSDKVQAAGFALYRADESMMAIKRRDANGNWRKHSQTFQHKAAMYRELKRILQDPKAIMG